MSEQDVATARLEAVAARERLLGSAQELQARLRPGRIAGDAWDGVRDKGEKAAAGAARAVTNRPVAAGAAAIGVAALLARKPIGRLLGRLRGPRTERDGDNE